MKTRRTITKVAQPGIVKNSTASLNLDENRRIAIKQELSLEEMLSKVTEENRHELIDFGPPVGKELI